MKNVKRYAFSGLMFAGKDHVAKTCGLSTVGFADPIYELVHHFVGTNDKTKPGVRRLMQQIGQWGQGMITEEYPVSAERAALTAHIRNLENYGKLLPSFPWVKWSEYGKRQDFWVSILLQGLNRNSLFQAARPISPNGLAVTNARFEHELQPLKEAGFEHFHIMCSPTTRSERMAKSGYKPVETEVHDYSEHLAGLLNKTMPRNRVIWNDPEFPSPPGVSLTLESFKDVVEQSAIFKDNEVQAIS